MIKKLIISFLFSGFALVAFAQETRCSDGVDNDGDGFIDCFDGDCAGSAVCKDNYIGSSSDCQLPQPPGSDFSMVLKNQTEEHVTSTHGRFVIGDMGDPVNGKDGIPEVVTAHTDTKKIYILDGKTLDVKYEGTAEDRIDRYDIAIADVANSGCARIFVAEVGTERVCTRFRNNGSCRDWEDVTKHYISSWDCQANQVWRREVYGRPFTFGLADFDSDGMPELYYRNEILDATTGQTQIAGSGDWSDIDGGPVAVDILDDSECPDCAGLELVAGGEIYSVNLNAPGAIDGGSLTLVKKFNDIPGLTGNEYWHTKYLDLGGDQFVNSQTSIADYDQDGYLDVLMTGTSQGGKTTIFYWNVKKNQGKVFRPANNWQYGAGRLNLADLDGDGQMNVAFVSGGYLFALDENLDLLWKISIQEFTSGYTSTTVFDFNNDGASEIVYRDEQNLYIIKGDGTFSPPIQCKSLTSNEYPIVADVDADGSTEICVVCQDNYDDDTYKAADEGVIRTYKSGNEPWVSARQVWNQHGYFNVNVNDDLTIPVVQQKHHVVFSTNKCGPGENRVLNSFLNQSAILNSDGCKTYPSADIAFLANPELLNITPPTCPDQDFHVGFTIENIGSVDLTGDIPITFYNGDPTAAGAVKLTTKTVSLANFKKGDQLVVPDMTVTGTGGTFTLFAVLNDKGTAAATPIVLPNSDIDECNLGNNIASATVNPQVFNLTTSSTDHIQCGSGSSPPNGSAKAFKPEGAVEQTVGYTFYWFDGTTAGAPGSAAHTGSQVTGLTPGTYTVYALHDAYQCGSDTVRVVVGQESLSISATVNVDQSYTNCNSPDGQLSVTPGAGVINDYTYEWFEGTVFGTSPTLSDSSVLRFTRALTYSVLVTQKSSGCETLESGTVPDLTVSPTVTTAVVPANCSPANSGQASATVAGVTAGYSFYWYDGATSKPTEDFLGDSYGNVTAGTYTVIAKDNATGCLSNQTVATVPAASGITVSAAVTAQQTSCATPNGAASANVGGATAGYTFKWFNGNNTLNQIGASASITGLAAGDYTVEATNISTGCTNTQVITIVDNISIPSVTPSLIRNQGKCSPADGAVSAVAAGSPGPYTYYWFNGNIGTPDTTVADFKGAAYSGLTAGFYTVVAVNANTRCGSARGVIQVLDQTVNPVITTAIGPQTSCNPAAPNGQISANVGGITAGYKFRWSSGADTSNFIVQSPVIASRAAGTYTVKAVSLATGCFATKPVVINDASARPTLSLVAVDNTICNASLGYTGSVTASFATNPNAQPAHTYVYEWKRNASVIPGQTSSALTGVNAGVYEVTVTNQQLGCVSDPTTIGVQDAVVLPDITTVQVGSTNCDPALANGQAKVTDVDGAGSGAPYVFQWYTGSDTSIPIPGATGATATNVQGGTGRNYTVLVTNQDNGCQNTATIQVQDNKALPDLALSPGDNNICDASLTVPNKSFDGSVSAVVINQVGSIADYVFAWYNGASASDPVNGTSSAPALTELNGGDYTVIATHTPTGCESNPFTAHVNNTAILPVITTAQVGSTNCDPALSNGQVLVTDVDGSGTGAPFVFRWFAGSDTSTPIAGATGAGMVNVQGGTARNYTVLVTNQGNGCQNTATVLLPDISEKPIITLSAAANTICDPSLIVPSGPTYNGSVQVATVMYKGAAFSGPGSLSYKWFNGAGTGTPNGSSTNATLSNLDNGFYSAAVTIDDLGCESDFVSAEVVDDLTLPAISFSATAATNCAGGTNNGTATALATGLTGETFVYAWHTGNLAGPAVSIPDGGNSAAIVRQQGGQSYTVEVTTNETGCANKGTVQIPDNSQRPAITPLTFTNNNNCDAPFDGTASVDGVAPFAYHGTAITNPYAGFTLAWSGGGTVNAAGDGITGLAAGTYSLQVTAGALNPVTNNNDNCISDPVQVTIVDDLVYPQLSTSILNNQTSCDTGSPNGQLEATETSGSGTYTFDWFQGTGAGAIGSGLAEVAGVDGRTTPVLASDDYTLLVANSTTRCQTTATVFLPENIVLPALTLVQASPVTTCAIANGEITVTPTVTSSADGDFTVYYLNEAGNNFTSDPAVVKSTATYVSNFNNDLTYRGTPVATPGTTLGPGLAPGLYTALVRDEITHCESDAQTIRVDDNTVSADIAVDNVVAASFCAATEGNIDISITGGTGPYTVNWFDGGPTNSGPFVFINNENEPIFGGGPLTPVVPAPGTLTPGQDLWNLAVGIYTVLVEDANGCGTIASVDVPFQNAPIISLTSINSTKCDPLAGDGGLALSVNVGSVSGAATYSYVLKHGLNPATATYLRGEICTNGTDDDGDGDADAADSECQASFFGNPGYDQSYSNLNPGDYLIEVIDHTAGCSVFRNATIEVDALKPVVTIGAISANTACDDAFADGSVEITVSKDPLDGTVAAPDYRITSITAANPSNATNPALYPLPVAEGTPTLLFTNPPFVFGGGFSDQTYAVNVEEVNSGCTVSQFVTIPSQPAVPDISVSVSDESFCAPQTNGGAQVSASAGAVDEYEFTWYNDASLAAGKIVYQANGTGVLPPGGERLDATKSGYMLGAAGQGAGDQTFYVRAQRLPGTGPGAGCKSPARQVVIRDTHVTPIATLSSLPNTSCDPLVAEGSVSISTTTSSTDGAVAGANYDYSISPDPNTVGTLANQGGALSKAFIDLPENTYTTTVLNRVSGCLAQNDITVSPNKYQISLTDALINNKLVCNPDGDITVTEITIDRSVTAQAPLTFPAAGALAANFEFRWFKGAAGTFTSGAPLEDDTGPAIIDGSTLTVGSAAGEYNDPAPTLGAGIYYVVARQLGGAGRFGANCESAPLMVEIKDQSVDPVIALKPFSNTSCDPATFEGEIEVDVTDGSTVPAVPGPAFGYTYAWTALTAGRAAPNPSGNPYDGNSNLFSQVQDGVYELRATNTTTGCVSTKQTTVQQNTTPIFVQNVFSRAQLFCGPSGSLEVRGISYNDRAGATTNVTGAGLADFTFQWFKDGTAPGNAVGGATAVLDSAAGNYPGIGADPDYYVVATRMNNSPGLNCSSAPFKVAIKDERKYPVIALTPFSNTSCDPATFEGEIEVNVTDGSLMPAVPGPAFGYTYTWSALTAGRAAPNPLGNPYDGNSNLFSQVQDGVYELRATNTTTGCASTKQATIQQNTTPIFVQNVISEAQLFCGPSGSLEVRGISYNDRTGATTNVTGAGLADFTFQWFKDGTAPGNTVGGATAVLDSAAGNYPGIGADPDYYVVATRMNNSPGLNCSSAPFRVAIMDKRQDPVVTFGTTANTTCNNSFDASITVSAKTGGIGNGADYSIVWNSNPGVPVSIANVPAMATPYTTTAPDNIGPGTYTATVTNLTTQCFTMASVTVQQNTIPVQIWDVTKIDQTDCAPFNGSIAIDSADPAQVSVPGAYTFVWEKAGVPVSPAPLPDNMLPGIDAGVYTVTGTKSSGIAAGCTSAPFSVTVVDRTERPAIQLQAVANFACDPLQANGELSAVIFEGTNAAAASDYNLEWFAGKNVTSGPVLGTSDMLTSRPDGDYTLVAVDNVSPNRGCDNLATAAIGFDKTSFSVAVAPTAQNLCAPGQNGSIAVTGITEVRNGASTPAANLALYDYQWSDEGGIPHPSTPMFTTGANAISNLLAGEYHVRVRNALGCVSTESAGVVQNLTVLPAITLDNFLNPTVCVMPETAGYLQVSADNSLNFSDYTFEWFEGPDDTGTLVEANNATLENIMYNQPTEYTVRVTNIATNCVSLDTYRFDVDTVQIEVIASAVGRTNCVVDDGNLFATTLNGSGALYNYEWYAGPAATGTPVYTTKQVAGVPIGQYTVIAVDPSHAFCTSTSYTTRVTDERLLPPVVAVQRSPLTYCDPAKPNGVAYASVDGGVVGYTFDWFQGSAGGTPVYTGPEIKGLTATTYVVRATDAITGCDQTASIMIENDPVDVQEPTIVVVSNRTNCAVPDGMLSASVNGNTANYILQWYDGNTVSGAADEAGEFYRDLVEGSYTVTATDKESGCVSDPVVGEVLPMEEKPVFDVVTVPTNCEQNIGEAAVNILNNVQVSSIEWDINGVQQTGARIAELPKGEFSVIVTTFRQCSESKTFVIQPEVLVFNGISRNNDGQNDFFEIACIQDFQHNNVKIFDRAGTLVYEANGYDNQDVFFDGISNRGINLLGRDLPDGTYFYIIDKRDGSKPVSGYLELLSN